MKRRTVHRGARERGGVAAGGAGAAAGDAGDRVSSAPNPLMMTTRTSPFRFSRA